MKRLALRIISLALTVLMITVYIPATAYAVGTKNLNSINVSAQKAESVAEFSVDKVSETPDSLVVNVTFLSGSFVCFDATMTGNDNLQCSKITFSEEFTAFCNSMSNDNGISMILANPKNGMMSVANTLACTQKMVIATYTYTKLIPRGVVSSDVSLTFESCYTSSDETDIRIDTKVTNNIPEQHKHVSDNNWVVIIEPTCKNKGTEVCYCTECGMVAETREIECIPHDTYEVIVKEPTCTTPGLKNYVCRYCGEIIKTEVIPPKGHKYIWEVKEATCTEDGYRRHICSDCGAIDPDAEYEIYTHTGHDFPDEWTVVREASYTSTGLERRYCKKCSAYEEREIPKLIMTVSDISLSQSNLSMIYKGSYKLEATILPQELSYTSRILWSSSNTNVATVDSEGNVYATGKGPAVITASTADGTITSDCTVKVSYNVFQWIIIYLLFGWIWY